MLEYAVILLMLKKRRKPRRTIDEGLKNLFSQNNVNNANDTGHSGGRRKQPVSETRVRQIAVERGGRRASCSSSPAAAAISSLVDGLTAQV